MTHPPRSTPAVVEHLVQEFEGILSAHVVTRVVLRLSRNGAVSLPVLTEMARQELTAKATALREYGYSLD